MNCYHSSFERNGIFFMGIRSRVPPLLLARV
jgi:hypothetical protein